ncbi:extensin family protein [Ciceribacter sp. L1K23]|uniref:extensin family protein n=1 Tax=Ciceribacter sp. L1K23 TaxID=2820276 RepID=UPI001B817F98|nr:extensin family protein [Ciceribacter sp. L1K23]MBR0554628.1 extensin family protein [Ciceribacter sp. L1K23]
MLKRLALAAALFALPALAAPDTIPAEPPVPLPKPMEPRPVEAEPVEAEAPAPAEVPVPTEKPEEAPETAPAGTEADDDAAATPATDADKKPNEEPGSEPPAEMQGPPKPPAPPPAPPVAKEDEEAYRACIGELKTLGVTFKELPRIDDGDGCGIDKPIAATTLSSDVTVEPELTARCETVLQLARMTRDFVEPAAGLGLADMGELKTVRQASGYVCRKRNSAETGKISEHARGNAVDIAGLDFEKGSVAMEIAKPEDSDLASAFQRAFNAFACLYFTTVLSPGSDTTHQDHMHLDVMERRGGYRYCR